MNKKLKLLIVGGVHGDEKLGVDVVKTLRENTSFEGECLLGNEKAIKKNKRFTETDLNRSFGSQEKISLEEKLTVKIKPLVEQAEVVIDIHTTKAKGTVMAIIVSELDKNLDFLIKYFGMKMVVIMPPSGSLISQAKNSAISLEYSEEVVCMQLQKEIVEKIIDLDKFSGTDILGAYEIFEFVGHVYTTTFKRLGFRLDEFSNVTCLTSEQKRKLGLGLGKYCPIFYKGRYNKETMFTLVKFRLSSQDKIS